MTSTDIVTGEGITMTDPNPREPKHISEHVTEALAQMTAPDGPYKWGPSSVPCPPWCSLPSGHSHVSVHAADEDMPVEKARALSAAIARAADLAEEPGGLSVTPAADGRAQLVWIVDDRGDLIVDVDTTMLGPGVFISDRVEQVAVSNVELLDELIRGLQKARRVLVKSAS
jgi:hypothetical protein